VNKPKIEKRQVFIGNLAFKADERELVDVLEAAGIFVFHARVVTNRDTGKSKGYAFVDIDRDDPKSVDEIIDKINESGIELYGRVIRADIAHTKAHPEVKGAQPSIPDVERDFPKAEKPRGGRGHNHNEFQQRRNEIEDD